MAKIRGSLNTVSQEILHTVSSVKPTLVRFHPFFSPEKAPHILAFRTNLAAEGEGDTATCMQIFNEVS